MRLKKPIVDRIVPIAAMNPAVNGSAMQVKIL
jgi:hypothetical protein